MTKYLQIANIRFIDLLNCKLRTYAQILRLSIPHRTDAAMQQPCALYAFNYWGSPSMQFYGNEGEKFCFSYLMDQQRVPITSLEQLVSSNFNSLFIYVPNQVEFSVCRHGTTHPLDISYSDSGAWIGSRAYNDVQSKYGDANLFTAAKKPVAASDQPQTDDEDEPEEAPEEAPLAKQIPQLTYRELLRRLNDMDDDQLDQPVTIHLASEDAFLSAGSLVINDLDEEEGDERIPDGRLFMTVFDTTDQYVS